MKVFTVSLIIFLLVLVASLVVGFTDVGGIKKSTPALNTSQSKTPEEEPQNMPSGLRIIVEPTD